MPRRWIVRVVGVVSMLLPIAVVFANAAGGWPAGWFDLLYAAITIAFAAVGWLIAERRPGNAVGPLVLAFALLFALYLAADLYLVLGTDAGGGAFAAVFVSSLDAPMFVLLALSLIVFPDGRPPSPRWRPVLALGAIAIVLAVVGIVIESGPLPLYPRYVSPLGIAGVTGAPLVYAAYAIMLILLVAGAAALTVRWRRGDLVERAQIKWVVAAALLVLVVELVNVATFRADEPNALTNIAASVAITLIPVSMAIAILRYHLYDIDRIVSRTIGYLIVTGILAVVFVTAVLAFGAVLSPLFGENPVAVAASTLIVAALFQPLRVRVQRVVDRRFYRARYDAQRTSDAFASRLRDEVDLAALDADLAAVVRRTLAPVSLGLWLHGREGSE